MPRYLFPKPQLTKEQSKKEGQKTLEPLFDSLMLIAGAVAPPSRALLAADMLRYSAESEAAFVTPSAGAKNLRKFADATLEHLPNPKNLKLDDITDTTLGELYSTSAEGREILNRVPGLRSTTVKMSDKLPPESRGRFLWNPASGVPEVHINAFPLAGEFKPTETLTHEVQHVIDALQGRVSGTSPTAAGKRTSDLLVKDVEANTLPDGTIEKKTLNDIMDMSEVDVYLRQAGENRARIDAGQFPQFENFATWFEDVLTGEFKTGR
jgi:hypothetical protein